MRGSCDGQKLIEKYIVVGWGKVGWATNLYKAAIVVPSKGEEWFFFKVGHVEKRKQCLGIYFSSKYFSFFFSPLYNYFLSWLLQEIIKISFFIFFNTFSLSLSPSLFFFLSLSFPLTFYLFISLNNMCNKALNPITCTLKKFWPTDVTNLKKDIHSILQLLISLTNLFSKKYVIPLSLVILLSNPTLK